MVGGRGSAPAGVESTVYSWRGADFRKEEERSGDNRNKLLCLLVARTLSVRLNMGVWDFRGTGQLPTSILIFSQCNNLSVTSVSITRVSRCLCTFITSVGPEAAALETIH